MKRTLELVIFAACIFAMPTLCSAAEDELALKPRVIATTDGEIDDRCSMIRFLLYANEWDIQGIIHSSSKFHWKGDDAHPEKDWKPVEWLDRQLDAYEEVYPNLKKHDPAYPSPGALRSLVYVGNIAYEGDMDEPSPGSDRIVEVLLKPDDSPVWLQTWGGSNTIARALKTIQDEHRDRVDEVTRKARLFLIAEQDNTLQNYILPEWPDLQVVLSDWASFEAIAYPWKKVQPEPIRAYFDREWMTGNILENHGPLCAMYEDSDGRFRSEGDTPAFLHVIDTGLRSHEHPSYGGWGGRFHKKKNGVWESVDVRGSGEHSILRWAIDFQNDWASRADWCVADYGDANHPPQVRLDHGTDLECKAGQKIALDASTSTDPDDDALSFHWWQFTEAGTSDQIATIESPIEAITRMTVPDSAKPGDTIHIVCTVTDAGTPPLTRYARVVLRIVQ